MIVVALTQTILLIVGCTRQLNLQASNEKTKSEQLPFEYTADATGISPTASLISAEIPAGTPITIRLQADLNSAACRSGDGFDAVLDKPIFLQGQSLAPAGSAVRGKVLAAKASGSTHDPGFLRITLTEISVNGRFLSLQTSSIFAKGVSREKRAEAIRSGAGAARHRITLYPPGNKDAGFSADRPLTFRLTQAWPGQS